jgi:regulatory protein
MARRRPSDPPTAPDASTALEIAARFLGTRPRTRWELERRLHRAGAADDTIAATTARLAELGYLDDAAFARWWADQRDRHSPRGRRMVEAELRRRGVPRDIIEADRAVHAEPERPADGERLPSTELERATAALATHLRGRPMPTDATALQRVGMYLMRRGFDAETVRTTIRAAGVDTDDDG